MNALKPLVAALTAAALVAGAQPAQAQMTPPPVEAASRDLTAREQGQAIEAVLAVLDAQYVFPERLPTIRKAIRAAQAKGRYVGADSRRFAERLSEDLRRASSDGHLYLVYDPDQFAAAGKSDGDGTDAQVEALWASRFRALNYGLTEQRVLPGGVRYLKISLFGWVNDEAGAYDSAMAFLKGGQAAIIDLRGNGGGSHDAVRYVLSHFMVPDRLLATFLEAGHEPVQSYSLTHVPAGRMIGKPLYVLIDHKAASAGEEFAYSVRQFGLGTLIGQPTAGGANNNRFVPVAPGFMLSVSYGRPKHPVTGSNWEGVGVQPNVEVPADQALERAQALAKEALASRPKG